MTHGSRLAALAALAWAIGYIAPARAVAPMAKVQAPGFYRMMLGDFEVTALSDGVVMYATSRVLPGATPQQIKQGLAENGLSDPVGMSYNAYLINTGTRLVLIDTGSGGKLENVAEFHGTGHLLANLQASGYRPEQVDEVYITHLGPDHVGGLTRGTERTFPNALLRAPQAEVDLFLHPETAAAWTRSWTPLWSAWFAPYIKAGRFASFAADVELTPGIRALATHGHSPGHTSYILESRGQKLIVMGDLVLMGALQFAHPTLESPFDADPKAAAQQRLRVLGLAADAGCWVAGSHLSFPGIGHVRAAQGHYVWLPANHGIP